MLIGYARVSTDDQNRGLQRDALKEDGCERIFEDTMSGAKADRDGLAELINVLRAGDTVIMAVGPAGTLTQEPDPTDGASRNRKGNTAQFARKH